jgi:hypothetical protein
MQYWWYIKWHGNARTRARTHTTERDVTTCTLLVNITKLYYLKSMHNIKFFTLYIFTGLKQMNKCKIIILHYSIVLIAQFVLNKREFLAIAEEYIHLLDKCVTMWTKISLTASETPLSESYMTVWNTCRGDKTDIHNE